MRRKKRFWEAFLIQLSIVMAVFALCITGVWLAGQFGTMHTATLPEVSQSESSILPVSENSAPSQELSSSESMVEESAPESSPERFAAWYNQADEWLSQMTLEEKIGQLFLADVPDDGMSGEINRYFPAGFVLFAADFEGETPESLCNKLADAQSLSKTPLFFAVDEEGGDIVRLSKYPAFRDKPFPSPQSLYQTGGTDALAADAAEKSEFLLNLGINLNLAPVCDVSENPEDYIYDRTLGVNAAETAQGISAIVSAMENAGISCTLKHFPGYGNNTDTHTGFALDKRPFENFQNSDFLPFQAGIEAGADAVLVSHNLVECMDPSLPASLSPEVHRILRDELGFTGAILTDDLSMDALKEYGEDAAVLAIKAGNTMLISRDFSSSWQTVWNACAAGSLTEDQIEDAVRMNLAWKLEKGLLK